jgi:hypothetical protein
VVLSLVLVLLIFAEAKFRNGLANDTTTAYNGDVAVNDGFRMLSNATTSGWLNIGTTAVGTTLGSKIGAGDLYVGRNATTTGNLTIGAWATSTSGFYTASNIRAGGQVSINVAPSDAYALTIPNTGSTSAGQQTGYGIAKGWSTYSDNRIKTEQRGRIWTEKFLN